MKRTGIFNYLAMALASLTLMLTLSIGVLSIAPKYSYAQEASVVAESQHQEASSIVAEPSEEAPKLCKDAQGNEKVCSNEDVLNLLAASIGGASGLGTLGIAGLIVNLIMFFLYSPMGSSLLPKKFESEGYKLLLALSLYLVSGVIGLMLPPTSLAFGAALIHSTTLAAFGVLFNQLGKKYLKSKVAAVAAS